MPIKQPPPYPHTDSFDLPIDLHPVERAALEAIIQPYSRHWPLLAEHLAAAAVKARHYTGVGCYTDLVLRKESEPLRDPISGEPMRLTLHEGGVELRGGSLKIGAAALAFVVDGYLSCLEIAAYGDGWDEDLSNVSVVTR